jgi:hypothetical protein
MLSSGDELSDSYAEAQYLQGVMYDTGEGVQQDSQAALRLYILAADQDHAAAQIMLGVMYADGNGVPKDPVMAYMWFNLATRLGAEDAKRYRQDVARSMTPTQIAEAQQMTLDWFEEHPRSP